VNKPAERPKIEYVDKNRVDAPTTQNSVSQQPTHNTLIQTSGKFKVFTADQDYPAVASPFTYRKVFTNNNTYFVVAEPGDTYEKIATDVQVSAANLRRFNDAGKDGQPVEKEIVYIESKAKHNDVKVHIVERGETLRYIAQRYAVQLSYIFKYNGMNDQSIIQPGNQIWLKH
jgi:LysM repeat protein